MGAGKSSRFSDSSGDYSEKKVLEVGCGIGTDIYQFAKNGAIVTGIDLTDRAIELVKKRFDLPNKYLF